MDTTHFVREMTIYENKPTAKTGDKLPDGNVLLRERDMNRMKLSELRHWLEDTVDAGVPGIALYTDRRYGSLLDEEYNV